IIMDGNGRWAKSRRRPRVFGHQKGATRVRSIIEAAGEVGVKYLTLFAFSEENWSRPHDEVSTIFRLINRYLLKERADLMKKNVKFRVVGDMSRLPKKTQEILAETTRMTAENTGLVLNAALSYSGRWDLTESCRRIAQKVADGEILPSEISSELISKNLGF